MRHALRVAAVAVCVVVFSWSQAAADWDPGDFYKWVQLPDLTTSGIDVWTDPGGGWRTQIADDFLCTSTDPITNFHIWGSWLNDIKTGGFYSFQVIIYDENGPAGGNMLWYGSYGDYNPWGGPEMSLTERLYYTLPEGEEMFWDARLNVQIGTDTQIWQYNFDIAEEDAFVQQGSPESPVTYWVLVMMKFSVAGEEFGWKTRDPLDGHFGDNAVFYDPGSGQYLPLVYPAGHPYEGQSIDLAFVITPEPATVALMGLGTFGTLLLRRKRR